MTSLTNENRLSKNRSFMDNPSFKLLVIGIIAFLLLIPRSFILDLIEERHIRHLDTESEIQSKWSNEQTFSGPFLRIAFWEENEFVEGNVKKIKKEKKHLFLLPSELEINGNLQSESLHRGIFEVPVYTNTISFSGKFSEFPFEKLKITPESLIWEDANFILLLSDLKGLTGNPEIVLNGSNIPIEPFYDPNKNQEGIQTSFTEEAYSNGSSFSGSLSLRGSKSFFAIPMAKSTIMNLTGNWSSPSFQGEYLPESRNVTEDGFESSWQISHLNRIFRQEYIGDRKSVV